MTEQHKLAYSITYTAFRAGSLKQRTLLFSAEEQIADGEAYGAMVEQVCRTAVSRGEANSLEDVCIVSVSLLNPIAPEPTEVETQQRDTDKELADLANNKRQAEYIGELEAAVVELYQDLKHAVDGDLDKNLAKIALENHEGVYVTCINRD